MPKFSALPAASSLDGTELVPVVQGGTTKRAAGSLFGAAHAHTGTYVATAGLSNGTNDTASLNTLLETARAAGGGTVKGAAGQSYLLGSPLVIGSGVTLNMRGCKVVLNAGANSNMVQNKAQTATATGTATTTAGSDVVTTTLGASAVVGQSLVVETAGNAGGNAPFVGLVAAATPTTITLTTLDGRPGLVTASVVGQVAKLYTRDTNIAIIGGRWDRGTNDGTFLNKNSIVILHADGVHIDLDGYASATSGVGKWAVRVGDVSRFQISGREMNGNDAVLVSGPAYMGNLPHVTGSWSYDDFVAFQAADWTGYNDVVGDITHVSYGVIGCTSAGASVLKIIAGEGRTVDAIKGAAVCGKSRALYGVWLGDDGGFASTVGGTYGDIDLGLVSATPATLSQMVYLASPTARRIRLEVAWNPSANAQPAVIHTGSSTATIQQLVIEGQVGGNAGAVLLLDGPNVTIKQLVIDGLYHDSQGATNRSTVNLVRGTVDEIVFGPGFRGTYSATSSYVVFQGVNTATVNRIKVQGVFDGAGAVLSNVAGCAAVEVTFNAATIRNMLNVIDARSAVLHTVLVDELSTFTSVSGTRYLAAGGATYSILSTVAAVVVPAPACYPVVGGGSPSLSGDAGSNTVWWALDATANEYLGTTVVLPNDWLTYDIYLVWSNAGAGAGNVRWVVNAGAVSDGAAVSATSDFYVIAAPATDVVKRSVTRVGITPPASKTVAIRVHRAASDGTDTLANDAGLIAIELRKAT